MLSLQGDKNALLVLTFHGKKTVNYSLCSPGIIIEMLKYSEL